MNVLEKRLRKIFSSLIEPPMYLNTGFMEF
jgi:hypothetical protein